MNDLSRLFAPDGMRDGLRKLGGLLIGAGLFMVFERKSGDQLGEGWGDWALLLVLLLAFGFLYGLGMLGRLNTPELRSWESVYVVFGILLAPFVFLQFVQAINGTPGASLNVFWAFLATAALAVIASRVGGIRYTALLASIAVIVSWSALWNKILSDGLSAHYGVYRVLLLIIAVLLLVAAFAASMGDDEEGTGRGQELITGAALAAVIAGSLSFTRLFESPFISIPTADSSLFWELVLLFVSLAALGYGSRAGNRGTTYVGAIGLFLFLVIAGSDINDSSPEGKVVGWPLVLVILGAVAFVASILPGLRESRMGGRLADRESGPPG